MGVLWLLALLLFAGVFYVVRSGAGRRPPRPLDRPPGDSGWSDGAPANAYDNPYATGSDNELASSGYCQGGAAQADGAIADEPGNDAPDGDSSDGSD